MIVLPKISILIEMFIVYLHGNVINSNSVRRHDITICPHVQGENNM